MSENNKIVINKNVPAKEIIEFRDSRGWTEWHTTANLIKSISIEAAELLELVQWEENIKDINRIKEELADVLIYSITLAEKLSIDINEIILNKIQKNAEKYPKSEF